MSVVEAVPQRHTTPLARKISNHVAFWGAVKVLETE